MRQGGRCNAAQKSGRIGLIRSVRDRIDLQCPILLHQEDGEKPKRGYFFSMAAFLHSERNFLRSLPCNPLASASLEHSIDSGLWTFAGFAAGAAESVLAAGAAVVWAKAGLANRMSDAKTVATVREEIVMRSTSGLGKGATVAP